MRIRRGDMVTVISGNDSSSVPHKVVQVLNGGEKVVVEGVNRVYKHVRRGHPKSPQGGRLQLELPIDASNVLLYCESCGRGTRTGFRRSEDGQKERFCKKCGKANGAVGASKAKAAAQ